MRGAAARDKMLDHYPFLFRRSDHRALLASEPKHMAAGDLLEDAVDRAPYANFRLAVDQDHLRVIVLIAVGRPRAGQKGFKCETAHVSGALERQRIRKQLRYHPLIIHRDGE